MARKLSRELLTFCCHLVIKCTLQNWPGSLRLRGTVPVSVPGRIRILPLHGHIILFTEDFFLMKLKHSWQKKMNQRENKIKERKEIRTSVS